MAKRNSKRGSKNGGKNQQSKGKNWFHEITQKHKQLMEQGQLVWRKPFKVTGGFRNTSGTVYRGVNVLHLFIDCLIHGWETPIFITTSELRKRHIKFSHLKGTGKHSAILRWVPKKYYRKAHDPKTGKVLIDDDTGKEQYEEAQMMVLKYVGTVWNIELFPELMEEFADQDKTAEDGNGRRIDIDAMVETYLGIENAPTVNGLPGKACYSPGTHSLNIPPICDFESTEAYYDVLFHEMGHSTGHKSLLARRSLANIKRKGDHAYSQEELVAEFTACFLDAEMGIDRPEIVENTAAYLQGWWTALNKDEGMLARAVCNAQKAFFLITGMMDEFEEEKEAA